MADLLILVAVKAVKLVVLGIVALASCMGSCGTSHHEVAVESLGRVDPIGPHHVPLVVPVVVPVVVKHIEPAPQATILTLQCSQIETVPGIHAETGRVIEIVAPEVMLPPVRIETILAPDLLVPPKARDLAF